MTQFANASIGAFIVYGIFSILGFILISPLLQLMFDMFFPSEEKK